MGERIGAPSGAKRNRTSFVYHRDGGCCCYCGLRLRRDEATVDHYVAQSQGGGDELENLRLACLPCNQLKSIYTPEEWEEMIVRLELREKASRRQAQGNVSRLELLQRCAPYWRAKHLGAT